MSKLVVVCSDGTWNTASNKDRGKWAPTNVFKTFCAISGQAVRESKSSVVYNTPELAALYDPGVGTGMFERLSGGVFGAGLSKNVRDGYRFIVEHYEKDAKLFLFGFSRGAYTARSLGGMVAKCGVIKPVPGTDLNKTIEVLYEKIYRNRDLSGDEAVDAEIKRLNISRSISRTDIEMVGVWDTVGALGVPTSIFHVINRWLESFHDTDLNSKVRHGYHAVALDEQRKAFEPTLWQDRRGIEQVWFAGVHSNIGGGYADSGLSDITLEWMLSKAKKHGLNRHERVPFAIRPNFLGELRDSRSGFMRLAEVKRRDVASTDRNPVLHGSVLRRIADRLSAYDPAAIKGLQAESIAVDDGAEVPPPQSYECHVCAHEETGACGSGQCAIRYKKDARPDKAGFVAATCSLRKEV